MCWRCQSHSFPHYCSSHTCTLLLIKGWAAGEENTASHNAALQFFKCLGSNSCTQFPLPTFAATLVCFWMTLPFLPQAAEHGPPVPCGFMAPTGATAVAYCHPLAKPCLLLSFCWTFASGSSPPALSLSVKCCGSRRPVTMQSSSHPASYLLWLLERGGFLMGSLKGWHLTWEEIRGHTELLSGLLNCLGYSTEGKKAKGKQKAITLTLLRHNTLEQTERFGKVQTYERVQGLIAAT